jgi:type III restriction enzyme
MIVLKDYQIRVLDSLREFLRHCAKDRNPLSAFEDLQRRNGGVPVPYIPVVAPGLNAAMPYVCLRVPTGGGKTLLACAASGLALNEFLQADRGVVLWLVPSNTILNQTADSLRDPRHPYRRALEQGCGPIEVLTIEEALRLSLATVESQTVVIVATIQSFRAEDTTGRRVYSQNGSLTEHFENIASSRFPDLLLGADGRPTPSLVNVLRSRRPIVIIDEAHNARTELSFSTLGNVSPSCVIEFTATPARTGVPSNVLHRVSAAELKAADMIKLPLRVIVRELTQRDQLLAEAVTLRSDLERLAVVEGQETSEYIRPILLLQAESVDLCQPLKQRLVAEFNIPVDQIAISHGGVDQLPSAEEIKSPACAVRFIITVQKLREGWDCPFAYVLCSLKPTRSPTAIEQLVGRVLRLPLAKAKRHPDLNCSFVFSVSPSIADVLGELRDALENHGFTKAEAERIVIPVAQGVLPIASLPQTVTLSPTDFDATVVESQVGSLNDKVRINSTTGRLTVFVPLDTAETERLASFFNSEEARNRVRATVALVRDVELAFGGTGQTRVPSGYERQIDFVVPRLSVREQDTLFEFESTFLLEHPWQLSAKDASLREDYDPRVRAVGRTGTIDVGNTGEVITGETGGDFIATLHQHVLSFGTTTDWSLEDLIVWLDARIDHQDIPVGESASFLRKAIRGLLVRLGTDDVSTLAFDRFRLRDELDDRIQQHRERERQTAFRSFLLPGSPLVVDDAYATNFKTIVYEPSWLYAGGFQFRKHYFGPRPGELSPTGEECRCAQFLDGLEEVEHWIRNLARRPTSFRLQTSTDWFYPDFVCLLKDGRILVVEYKGGHMWQDAEEKRAVGAVWAARSNGHCLFVMPTEEDFATALTALRRA